MLDDFNKEYSQEELDSMSKIAPDEIWDECKAIGYCKEFEKPSDRKRRNKIKIKKIKVAQLINKNPPAELSVAEISDDKIFVLFYCVNPTNICPQQRAEPYK